MQTLSIFIFVSMSMLILNPTKNSGAKMSLCSSSSVQSRSSRAADRPQVDSPFYCLWFLFRSYGLFRLDRQKNKQRPNRAVFQIKLLTITIKTLQLSSLDFSKEDKHIFGHDCVKLYRNIKPLSGRFYLLNDNSRLLCYFICPFSVDHQPFTTFDSLGRLVLLSLCSNQKQASKAN